MHRALGLALRSSFSSFGSYLELASIITVSAGVSAGSAAFRVFNFAWYPVNANRETLRFRSARDARKNT